MIIELKQGFKPIKYIKVTNEFRDIEFKSNADWVFKGELIIQSLFEMVYDDVTIFSFDILKNNMYVVIITYLKKNKSYTKHLLLKEDQYLVIDNYDVNILDEITYLKDIIITTIDKQKERAIIRGFKHMFMFKHRDVPPAIINDTLSHMKSFMKRGMVDIDVLFKKYVLKDEDNKIWFKDQIRKELEVEYPTFDANQIESYVNLILKQSK